VHHGFVRSNGSMTDLVPLSGADVMNREDVWTSVALKG
jgi:hypothetical protein